MVTILLERSFAGVNARKIGQLLRELRVLAMQQPGYINSRTLLGENDAEYSLVTNTWETWKTLEYWQAWLNHPERRKMETEVDGLLEAPTTILVSAGRRIL